VYTNEAENTRKHRGVAQFGSASALGFEHDRRRWRKKGVRNGAAVKISAPPQGAKKFWKPQEGDQSITKHPQLNIEA